MIVAVEVKVGVEVAVAPVIGRRKANPASVGLGELVGVKNSAAKACWVNARLRGVGVGEYLGCKTTSSSLFCRLNNIVLN